MINPPPKELMYDGPAEEWESNGQEYLEIYKTFCGLKPNAKMLDVGSGLGRKTIPLTNYFTSEATYIGIDVKLEGVYWCKNNITPKFPNFHFAHIDVYASGYNLTGKIKPEDFKFPFVDNTFDFVALNSVFTHMRLPAIANYLREVARVLKPEGRCLASYFLLDRRSEQDVKIEFPYIFDSGRIQNEKFPEQAIAFYFKEIGKLYKDPGFRILHRFRDNRKSRFHTNSYQDLILAD